MLHSRLVRLAKPLCLAFLLVGMSPQMGMSASWPWRCEALKGQEQTKQAIRQELQGEWRSANMPSTTLTLTSSNYTLEHNGQTRSGSISESGVQLLFTENEQQCLVTWQLLGDGRMAINAGEDFLHRPNEPAIPVVSVRQYGAKDCRFTVSLPPKYEAQELEDGVQVISPEKDAFMLIFSGTSKESAFDFASALAKSLGSTDLKPVPEIKNAYTFTAINANKLPILTYVVKEGQQYMCITFTGRYDTLVPLLKNVKIISEHQ